MYIYTCVCIYNCVPVGIKCYVKCIYVYIYIHLNIPQADLSVGVLTVLYMGPWLVRSSGDEHGEHFSL
jgi:hypothetical protein